MRKVFLSLAALAFVATGAVSCSSDDGGSPAPQDDNVTPQDDNVVVEGSNFMYNGQTYTLDFNTFAIQGTEEGASIASYSYEEGGDSYAVTEWRAQAYPDFEDGSQPTHFLVVYFDVEVLDNGDDTYSVQLPNETENVFPYQVITVENGEVLSNSNYAFGQVSVNFDVFNLGEEELNVTYDGSDAVNSVTFNFTGISGLSVSDWQEVGSASTQSFSTNQSTMRKARTNINTSLIK